MVGVRTWTRERACALLLLSACGREAVFADTNCDHLAPGDLVITEVNANPDGSDGAGEYIELFNAGSKVVLLDGLRLNASRSDGTSLETHRFHGASIASGEYLVIGNAPVDALPEHIDYSYGSTLGSLRNSDGVISIECAGLLIDHVSYESTVDGRALEFDGRLAPDHELNDEAGHWCPTPEGVREVSSGNYGTPGVANSPCEVLQLDGVCLEDGSGRGMIAPGPGDVRITEWMANPKGTDAGFEWVELLFFGPADLNGVQLGPAPELLSTMRAGEDCFPVGAGSRVVFGASPAAAPRVDAELRFSLGNTGPRSIVVGVSGVVLDEVQYSGTVEGTAWQVDSGGVACLALPEDEYAAGNLGTPGEANRDCVLPLEPGMCFDNGVPRPIVSPRVGEVQITEWMANPSSVGNREGEWVEIRFHAAADLNGLSLSDLASNTMVVDGEACLPVEAGGYVVFARNTNPSENGGIPDVDAELPLSLNNGEETLTLSIGREILDLVTYDRSTAGVATQIDENGIVCDAELAFGDGDLGTPGSANSRCS
ncbi:MAG: lamin tail domain-containing protein [Polyangiales bacterium]